MSAASHIIVPSVQTLPGQKTRKEISISIEITMIYSALLYADLC